MAEFPNASWQILNLDPALATEADVKRAYARLIKEHRPDTDPEGFQEVRAAYQAAVEELRNKSSAAEEANVIHVSEGRISFTKSAAKPASEPPLALIVPAAFVELEERLAAAISALDEVAVGACLEEFRPLMKGDRTLWVPWGELLARRFVGTAGLLAKNLPAPGLIRLLEAGQAGLAQAVLVSWHAQSRSEDLLKVAHTLVPRADLIPDAPEAVCVARLATLVSFPNPKIGEKLANLAFKHLPPGPTREGIMQEVEFRLSLGRVFSSLPPDQARFWEERLTVEGDAKLYDWTGREARHQLEVLSRSVPLDWAGFGVLHNFLPAEIWKKVEERMQQRIQSGTAQPPIMVRQAGSLSGSGRPTANSGHSGRSHSSGHRQYHSGRGGGGGGGGAVAGGYIVLTLVVLLIKVVFLLFTRR